MTQLEFDLTTPPTSPISEEIAVADFKRKWLEDIQTISKVFNDIANLKGWCSEYDGRIQDLNTSLYYEIEQREITTEFEPIVEIAAEATFTIPIKVPIHLSLEEYLQIETIVEDQISESIPLSNLDITSASISSIS